MRLLREATRLVVALVAAHQYLALFGIVAIEEAGVPLPAPSDLVIAFYGYRARADPLELLAVVFVCACASTAGTLVPYAVTRRWGPSVARRAAGWVDVDPRRVDEWSARIGRHGFRWVLVGRLIPGLRVAMSLVAGTAHVPLHRFTSAVFLAAAVYWSGWVAVGVLLGPSLRRFIAPAYIQLFVVILPVVFVGYLAYRVIRARRLRGNGTGPAS